MPPRAAGAFPEVLVVAISSAPSPSWSWSARRFF